MESSIYFIILVSLYHLETSVKGDIFPSSKDSANAVAQNEDYIISMVPINDPNGRDCNGNDAMASECNKSSMELWPISAMSLDGSRNMIMLKFEEPPKTHLRIKNEKGATGGGSNEMGNFMAMGKPDFMRLGKRPFEKLPLVPMREIRGDGMRDSRGDSFMRFGRLPRTSAADFMRFGRDAGNFMRFGRTAKQQNYQTRSNNNFMRLGRPDNFMRFGRSSPPAQDENFMRFGKSSSDGGESNTQKDRLHVDKAYGYHNNNKVMSLFNKGTDEDMETDYLEN